MPNPLCKAGPGCGAWVRPTIRNPEYKGKWTAPLIDNPEYKGPWKARDIPNPEFYEDAAPLEHIGSVSKHARARDWQAALPLLLALAPAPEPLPLCPLARCPCHCAPALAPASQPACSPLAHLDPPGVPSSITPACCPAPFLSLTSPSSPR